MRKTPVALMLMSLPCVVAAAPVDYTVSVATDSNAMAAMFGGGNSSGFSLGGLMSKMMGKNMQGPQRSLYLELTSPGKVSDFKASHDIPSGLKMGPTLLLALPEEIQAVPDNTPDERDDEPQPREKMEKPKGRLLIYWGCGDKVGPGQPKVIDFAKLASGSDMAEMVKRMQAMSPGMMAALNEQAKPRGTRAHWPNRFQNTEVPGDGSLVGQHVLKGNFFGDIGFDLKPENDFLAPAEVALKDGMLGMTMTVGWKPIPNAVGYALTAFASNGDNDMVLWSSSEVDNGGINLLDYIPTPELRRLQSKKVVMPASATECRIAAPIFNANASPMLSFIAWGQDVTQSGGDRKNPWKVKVRYKSTGFLMLNSDQHRGHGAAASDGGRDYSSPGGRSYSSAAPAPSAPADDAKRLIKDKLKGFFGL